MRVALCVSKDNGMLFCNKRQSIDKKIIDDILNITDKIYITKFSEKMISSFTDKYIVCDDIREIDEAVYFIENIDISEYLEKIDTIYLYHWNREYPSDFFFDADLSLYKRENKVDFKGDAHDKITKEIFIKK